MIFVVYSFIAQFRLLFDHSFEFGIRTLEDYPKSVEEELERLKNLTNNWNSSLEYSF